MQQNNKNQKKLLVIVPAYNEEKNIAQVVRSIPKQIKNIAIHCLVVDDGSQDKTSILARENGAIILKHPQNKGVGEALKSGFRYALQNQYNLIVNIDADNQFNPQEIENLIAPLLQGKADFVVGNRFTKGKPPNMPLTKYWGNILMSKLISKLTEGDFPDVSCGFRAYNKKALLYLNLFGKFTYTQETFLNFSFKNISIVHVPVSVRYFPERKSKIANNLIKYIFKTLTIIIRSFAYYKPLRFFGYPGVFFSITGLSLLLFLFGHRLMSGSYTPYKIIGFMGGGFFVFGILLMFLGFLADILDKIRQNQEEILYLEKQKKYYGE